MLNICGQIGKVIGIQQNTNNLANLTANIQQNTNNLANLTANVQQNTNNLANLTANIQQDTNYLANVTVQLGNLMVQVGQIANNVVLLQQSSTELPIILSNSRAGFSGPLYNPTQMAQGWAPLLAAPNPRTRDELTTFTSELSSFLSIIFNAQHYSVQQCINSAMALGLPALQPQATVHERRRQIAFRIGVTIERPP